MDVSRSVSFSQYENNFKNVISCEKDIGFLLEPFLPHKAIILMKKRKKNCLVNALENCILLIVGCKFVEMFRCFLEGACKHPSSPPPTNYCLICVACLWQKNLIFNMELSGCWLLAVVFCGLCFRHVVSEILWSLLVKDIVA